MKTKAWLLATVFAVLLVPASAQAAGGVSGVVTAVGGGPLEGIEVCAREQSTFIPHCATTDSAGEYEIEELSAGKYRVKFEGGDNYVDRWFEDAANEFEAEVLSISSKLTEGVNAELPPAGRIEGTVTDAVTHLGVEDVFVCPTREGSFIALECEQTDAGGHYRLGGLPPGSYTVSFSAGPDPASRDYLGEVYKDSLDVGGATPVAVSGGAATTGIDAALEKGARITGTVTDESGEPVSGVTICAELPKPRRNFGPCGSSGEDGTYTIYRVPSGKYRVGFFPGPTGNYLSQYYDDQPTRKLAGTIEASAPGTVPNIDAVMHPGGQIEGTVSDEETAAPIANAYACAIEIGSEGGKRCDPTATDGTYAIGALPTGNYEVIFKGSNGYGSERWNDLSIDETGTPVAVTAGEPVTGIDAGLLHGGIIRGTVTAASDASPIQSIEVCAYRGHQDEGSCIFTSALGTYEFTGLDTGSYAVRFRPGTPFGPPGAEPSDPDYATQWYDGETTRADAQPLDVVPGGVFEDVDAEMTTGGRIIGTITAPGGAPLPSGYVCTVPSGSEEERCGFADHNGNYKIQGLPPGSYRVRFGANAVAGGAGWLPEYWNDKTTLAAAEEIEVTTGVTEEIDAQLQAAGAISGRVTVAGSGAPLGEAFVCAIPDGETEATNCAGTEPNGKYLIPMLPSGSYRVEFSVSYFEEGELFEEFATQFWKGGASLGASSPVSVTAGQTTGSIDAAMIETGSDPEPPDEGGGGDQPPGNPPAAPVLPPAPPIATGPNPPPKKPHCGKAKKLKKVRGKWRCVKKPKPKARHTKARQPSPT